MVLRVALGEQDNTRQVILPAEERNLSMFYSSGAGSLHTRDRYLTHGNAFGLDRRTIEAKVRETPHTERAS